MKSSAIVGIGVDLVENERMQELLTRWGRKFKDRVFLAAEQAYCNTKAFPHEHYAGRFAVKEAVSKAFGTGFGPAISLLDIEVMRDPVTGAPSVRLSAQAQRVAREREAGDVLVSLAHTRHYSVAQAVVVRAPPGDDPEVSP
jgi:holo-[acyl-carrier protein] synthase